MLSTTQKSFILVIDEQIEASASDWDAMRFYCSETGKSGKVFVVATKIPFGEDISKIVTTMEYFGEIR